ncbi:MAG TPA: glycogen synthase [Pyrinomonadaceae bacterium]|nr:glycogen synthase [Pyrinomonadaceae bacterium]
MRVAILSSEAAPFAQTGGLGDVSGALPKALRAEGLDAVLILPLHCATNRKHVLKRLVFDKGDLPVDWLGERWEVPVWESEAGGAPAYLIDAPTYFSREKLYGYGDDTYRYAFFNKAALTLLGRIGPAPDVIHGNDWTSGFGMVWLRSGRPWGGYLSGARTLLTIHNIGPGYQGRWADPGILWQLGFNDGERNVFLHDGIGNALKAGLMTCDAISTVSPRYASEIQEPDALRPDALRHGLDWLLRQRRERLVGITNGIDYDIWNPAADALIPAHFDADDLSGKRACKLELLKELGLPQEAERPLLASVTRLAPEKFELIMKTAGEILASGAFFVVLGDGADRYKDFLRALSDYAPQRVAARLGKFDVPLSHRIYAGADIFLMPSETEPCGLSQMYSMRYGTVPVVRATGGLDDTVEHFDAARGTGTGFKFYEYSSRGFSGALREALHSHGQPDVWRRVQLNGMRADNSWQAAARKYVRVYEALQNLD